MVFSGSALPTPMRSDASIFTYSSDLLKINPKRVCNYIEPLAFFCLQIKDFLYNKMPFCPASFTNHQEVFLMIKSILIPTDGSVNSHTALEFGIYLAKLFKAEITGLNVIDIRALEGPFLSDISGSLGFTPFQNYFPKFQKILEDRANVILDDFKNRCAEKSIDPRLKRMSGVIANVIAEEAKRVDLVVIAQRGEHEQWSTGLIGSTTDSVVRKSPRPVLVTPNKFQKVTGVLVAYDGSIEANRALKTACEHFSDKKIQFRIVFVTADGDRKKRLTDEVNEFVSPYKLKYEITCLEGDAGKEILNFSENTKTDLIAMGAFSHSRIRDLFLGGTTAYIIRKASIPVLLTR